MCDRADRVQGLEVLKERCLCASTGKHTEPFLFCTSACARERESESEREREGENVFESAVMPQTVAGQRHVRNSEALDPQWPQLRLFLVMFAAVGLSDAYAHVCQLREQPIDDRCCPVTTPNYIID